MKVIAAIQRFLNDEEGASGIEYAMIAGTVAVVLAASSGSIRGSVTAIFENVATELAKIAPAKT
jgi:pilus assembly protein Flp/PilA